MAVGVVVVDAAALHGRVLDAGERLVLGVLVVVHRCVVLCKGSEKGGRRKGKEKKLASAAPKHTERKEGKRGMDGKEGKEGKTGRMAKRAKRERGDGWQRGQGGERVPGGTSGCWRSVCCCAAAVNVSFWQKDAYTLLIFMCILCICVSFSKKMRK